MPTPSGLVTKQELIDAQLDTAHLGRVVNSKDASGAPISTSTNRTGGVNKTLDALEGEYETSIANKEVEADAAIDSYRLLNKGPYASGITLESKFEYITYNGESYFAVNPPYTTTATTPDADANLFLGGYTTFENVANKIGNKNELSNSNFLTPSPDAITHPNATPESYVAGTQIFSGVYAGDSGCTITLIDGRVNCTAGDYQFKLPNNSGLERVPVFTSSVSDYDGIPKTTGVSHALVTDEYVVTVTPAAGDVFSVKFEQGDVATKHEVKSLVDIYGDPSVTGIADIRAFGAKPSADNSISISDANADYPTYIPKGDWEFNSDITLENTIKGDGFFSKLITDSKLKVKGVRDIKDLKLQSKTVGSGGGLTFDGAANVIGVDVRNFRVQGFDKNITVPVTSWNLTFTTLNSFGGTVRIDDFVTDVNFFGSNASDTDGKPCIDNGGQFKWFGGSIQNSANSPCFLNRKAGIATINGTYFENATNDFLCDNYGRLSLINIPNFSLADDGVKGREGSITIMDNVNIIGNAGTNNYIFDGLEGGELEFSNLRLLSSDPLNSKYIEHSIGSVSESNFAVRSRSEFVVYDNSDGDVTGWTAQQGTLTKDTFYYYDNAASLRVTGGGNTPNISRDILVKKRAGHLFLARCAVLVDSTGKTDTARPSITISGDVASQGIFVQKEMGVSASYEKEWAFFTICFVVSDGTNNEQTITITLANSENASGASSDIVAWDHIQVVDCGNATYSQV